MRKREDLREKLVLGFEEKDKSNQRIGIANVRYVRRKGCSCNCNRTDTRCGGNNRLIQ